MKYLAIILVTTSFPMLLLSQTAEEILLMTQKSYRVLDNYIDQGIVLDDSYTNPPHRDTATYYLAMDREKNVAHWCKSTFMGRTQGAKFYKQASDSLGSYTRLGYDETPFLCAFEEAQGRLGATGRGILSTFGSLMFDNLNMSSDSSWVLHYDKAERLHDTTYNGEKCYMVKTEKNIFITQESIDARQHRSDSINGLLDLPKEQRASIPVGKAGNHFSTCTYTIQQKDSIIVQMEKHHYGVHDTIQYKSKIIMNPKYDVNDFVQYLK